MNQIELVEIVRMHMTERLDRNFWTKHKIHISFGFAFAMVMQMLPNPRNCIRIHIQCNSPAKSCNDDEAYEKQIQVKVILRKVY